MPRRLLLWGFRPPRDIVGSALGKLEQQVIDTVWRIGPCTVRQTQADLEPSVAYTTVMTTLDRLYRKGLLTRTRSGRMFVYAATGSRRELESAMAVDVVSDLLANDPAAATSPLLSNIVEAIGDRDRALLDELERLVKQKRERLNEGRPR